MRRMGARGLRMKKVVIVAVLAGLTLQACAPWRESRMNPRNWSGQAQPVQKQQLITEVEDARPLVPQITDLVVEPTPDGAIVRATGLPPEQGWWAAELVKIDGDDPTLRSYEFRILPPQTPTAPGTPFSRQVVAAAFLSNYDLQNITRVQVQAETNALSARR